MHCPRPGMDYYDRERSAGPDLSVYPIWQSDSQEPRLVDARKFLVDSYRHTKSAAASASSRKAKATLPAPELHSDPYAVQRISYGDAYFGNVKGRAAQPSSSAGASSSTAGAGSSSSSRGRASSSPDASSSAAPMPAPRQPQPLGAGAGAAGSGSSAAASQQTRRRRAAPTAVPGPLIEWTYEGNSEEYCGPQAAAAGATVHDDIFGEGILLRKVPSNGGIGGGLVMSFGGVEGAPRTEGHVHTGVAAAAGTGSSGSPPRRSGGDREKQETGRHVRQRGTTDREAR